MNVLSLFDGMSCGQIALNRAGIPYSCYYASEVDKKAIELSRTRFPETVHLGDVRNVKPDDLPPIDILMGGSPCQGFSFSGKELNFQDPRSALFFEFVRVLKETKPTFLFLENVVMQKRFQDVISEHLGVEPVEINSSLVSSQNRRRLYWANFPISQPNDEGIELNSILENLDMTNKATIVGRRLDKDGKRKDSDKNIPLIQYLEVRGANPTKSNCLTTVEKDNVLTSLPTGRYKDPFGNKLPFRNYTLKEYCRLQTVPENYFDGIVSDNQAKDMLGNGWTVDVIVHILKELVTWKNQK